MAITEKISALLPWRDERPRAPRHEGALTLHRDFDGWLQRFFEEPAGFMAGAGRWTPNADIQETDKEVVVRAELPGLEPEDLDLSLAPEGLVIRGERREEKKDKKNDFVEWCYGSFVETVPLPPGVEIDKAEARMKHGVLTVRFPRSAARPGARHIAIKG
jgi:HSP20 family protein